MGEKTVFYPLTYPQMNIWYLDKLYPETGIANLFGSVTIHGDIDYDLLARATNLVTRDCDALRLRFVENVNGPLQYITPFKEESYPLMDFSNSNGWEGFYAWLEELKSPLGDNPVQFYLFKIKSDEGGVLLKTHHAIADGWGGVLAGNLIYHYYKLLQTGKEPTDPWPSYIEFIDREKSYIGSPECEINHAFWAEKFASRPELASLKPGKQLLDSCEAVRREYVLSREFSAAVNEFCSQKQVSPFVFFLAALAAYLNRNNGFEDIVVGTPLHNRLTKRERMIVGMFMETIPIRLMIDSALPFDAFIDKVAKEWAEMRRHHHPYELILEEVRARHKVETNLFDIMINFQNAKFSTDADHDGENYHPGWQPEAMSFVISDRNNTGQYNMVIDYQISLFSEREIDDIFGHFIRLMEDALANPQKEIRHLSIMSDQEFQRVVYEFNPQQLLMANETVHERFERQAKQTPEKTALVFENKRITYRELNEGANRLARVLRRQGIGPGSVVGLLVTRDIKMITGILAILKAGAAYLPIDSNYPTDRIRFLVEDSGAKLILSNGHLADQLSCRVINLDVIDIEGEDPSDLENLNSPHDLAYILYTSGSTGRPKGVMVEHKSVCSFFKALEQQVDLQGKTVLSLTTVCFDIFVFETLLPLVNGLEVVLANDEQKLIPEQVSQLVTEHKINIFQATPSRMQVLMMDSRFRNGLGSLTDIILGGEVVPDSLLDELRKVTAARIFNGYGPTEATIYATFKDITRDREITIGRPVGNTRAYVLDQNLEPVPIGAPGELCLAGEGLARGYLNRPELTSERFCECPALGGVRVYRTGDRARWGEDGNLRFLGRLDNQVKVRGFRIELGEIEAVLREHPDVAEAVVIDQQDENNDKYICAYLVTRRIVPVAELRGYLLSKLPDYMVPASFVFLDKVPLNPNGKIDRRAVKEIKPLAEKTSALYAEPRNEVDMVLAEAWSKALSVERIGIDDNFFECGGTSLKIVRILVSLLPYNYDLTARDFYRYQTIRAISDKIRGQSEDAEWEGTVLEDIATVPFSHVTDNQLAGPTEELGHVLLTGATGYLGAHILRDLINDTQATVYCLVRGNSRAEAEVRLMRALEFYFPHDVTQHFGNRIRVIPGDVSLTHMGLDHKQYTELANMIDHVIHSAAIVRHYGGYEEFERINVSGTRRIVEFCSKRGVHLHYISTTTVSGQYLVNQDLGNTTFTEKDFYVGQHYFENVYVRSKFEAENMILKAINNGLKATIYRVGMLSGRFSDGQFQINIQDNAFANRIRSIVQLGSIPQKLLQAQFEFTPVDYCSRAVILIARTKGVSQRIFHLFNHNTISVAEFIDALHKCGYDIKIKSDDDFANLVKDVSSDPGRSHMLMGIINDLNFMSRLGVQASPKIDSTITKELLAGLGFEWPKIDVEYIGKVVSYMSSVGFIDSLEYAMSY